MKVVQVRTQLVTSLCYWCLYRVLGRAWTKWCKSKNGREDEGTSENLEMDVHCEKDDKGSM